MHKCITYIVSYPEKSFPTVDLYNNEKRRYYGIFFQEGTYFRLSTMGFNLALLVAVVNLPCL